MNVKKEQWYLLTTFKNSLYIEKLSCFYKQLLSISKAKEIILLGDVNTNLMQKPNCLNDLFDVYGLTNLVNSLTCYKCERGTLLDPVVVLIDKRFYEPINIQCGMSDWHNLVGCIRKVHMPRILPKTVTYRSYKNFDSNALSNALSNVPFHVNEIFDDVNDKYWFMNKLHCDVINEHAPCEKTSCKI